MSNPQPNPVERFMVSRSPTLQRLARLMQSGERPADTVDRVLIEYERFIGMQKPVADAESAAA